MPVSMRNEACQWRLGAWLSRCQCRNWASGRHGRTDVACRTILPVRPRRTDGIQLNFCHIGLMISVAVMVYPAAGRIGERTGLDPWRLRLQCGTGPWRLRLVQCGIQAKHVQYNNLKELRASQAGILGGSKCQFQTMKVILQSLAAICTSESWEML